MNMKLSRRDRVIILAVLVVVVIGVGILALVKPQYQKYQDSEVRLEAKQAEETALKEKIATLDDLKLQLKRMVDDITKNQVRFISEKDIPDTQQISQYVYNLLEPTGLEIISTSLADLSPTRLTEYFHINRTLTYPMKVNADLGHNLPEEVYGNYPSPGPEAMISATQVVVGFTSEELDQSQVLEAIQTVADHEKNIYLNTVSCDYTESEKEEGEPAVEGEMVITVFEIYPLDPADVDKD